MIFNKASGGGNKVKINGLPPEKRLNLKECPSIFFEKDFMPERLNIPIFIDNGDVYYNSTNRNLFRKRGNYWTNICSNCPKDYLAVDKKEDTLFIYGKIYNENTSSILKIENGNRTILGKAPQEASGYGFFLNDILYTKYGDNIYKSMDFGKNWTNITSNIIFKDGLTINDFDFSTNNGIFTLKGIRYTMRVYKNVSILAFDGNTLKKVLAINAPDTIVDGYIFGSARDCRNHLEKKSILIRENFGDSTSLYNAKWFDIEEKNNNLFFKATNETFCDLERLWSHLIDEDNKKLMMFPYENYTNFLKELRFDAYIPE